MEIAGSWIQWKDGETRPMIPVSIQGGDGQPHSEHFLVDTGADRTVLSEPFVRDCQLVPTAVPSGFNLHGISGASAIVKVTTALEFPTVDGRTIRVQGTFAAFTDPAATDYSILGRDVLDNFHAIVSRRRDQVRLLGGNHYYQILT
jgi:gag-polyprotein putative aspartyl protease